MTDLPVRAAPRPILAWIHDALLGALAPREPASGRRERPDACAARYAALDAPTYQRRGLRIAEIDEPSAAVGASAARGDAGLVPSPGPMSIVSRASPSA